VYPIRHDLYGDANAPRTPFRPDNGTLWELPLTTRRLFGNNIPSAGGGYFRLIPYSLWRRNLTYLSDKADAPCIFYFHPWEIDPAQPRVSGVGLRSRVRHYTNLKRMPSRLQNLLRDFRWARMDQVFCDLMERSLDVQHISRRPDLRLSATDA
jgi:polysaccharide deacetylase family protein (PEP-CTERM system associated)